MAFSKIQMRKDAKRKLQQRMRILEKHGYDIKQEKRQLERLNKNGQL